jgi:prolyl oligopeptidase
VKYPPTLITTADHDDRVFPAHSFKYAAAMQAAAAEQEVGPAGGPILIRIETRAGHGGATPLTKRVEIAADQFAFLVEELGMRAFE